MDVNQGNVDAIFQGMKALFAEALATVDITDVDRLMAPVTSTTGAENYPVATLLGDLEEVLDEVTITSIGKWVQNVPNRTFARIIEVKRNDLEDDNVGVYRPAVQQLARRAALYPLRLAAEALLAGFTGTWVDGQHPFSATHVWVGGKPWSNLQANALTPTNFDAACLALETRKGPDDQPLGLGASVLVCGPTNRAAAETILQLAMIGGTNNRQYKRCDLVVLRRLGTSTAWFVADDQSGKPMVRQERTGPEFTQKDQPTDDKAFYAERFAFKGRRRCAVAILAPWLIQASSGT